MKLIKDMGTKVQVEITQGDWVAIADALEIRLDALEHHPDQEMAKGWLEPLAEFLDTVPKDFLVRKED